MYQGRIGEGEDDEEDWGGRNAGAEGDKERKYGEQGQSGRRKDKDGCTNERGKNDVPTYKFQLPFLPLGSAQHTRI
jgi:hypothetical protein